jgi:hypothetical protein
VLSVIAFDTAEEASIANDTPMAWRLHVDQDISKAHRRAAPARRQRGSTSTTAAT